MTKNTLKAFILHGWTSDPAKWNPLVAKLKKNGISAQILKIPGLTTPLNKVWDLNQYVDWLASKIGNQKNIVLVAHSFGGRVAIRYVVKNPNQIKKLVLIDSAGIRPSSMAARFKRMSFWTLAKIGKRFTKHPRARKFLYKLAKEKDYHQANDILAQTMVKIIEDDQRKEIGFVKAHTLIIWGRNDKTTPLSDGRFMNKHITGSTLKIIEEAGHSPQYSHTKEVVELVCNFLKSGK